MSNRTWIILVVCFNLALVGCGSQKAKPSASIGACFLLTDSGIQEVQGEAIAEKTSSETSSGKLVTSQCFYRLPTFSRSINLEITRSKDLAGSSRAIDEFWERRFGQRKDERETDLREADTKGLSDEREEEEQVRPQPVSGIGDEAFWSGNQINGSLYFRKDDTIARVSIGGPDDQPTKINKARTLAEKILKNL